MILMKVVLILPGATVIQDLRGAGSWVHRFNDPDQRRYTHAHPQKRVLKTYFASFLITLAETQSLTDMIAIAREEGFL